MFESSMALLTIPDIVSSLESASVLILSCFLFFRIKDLLSFVDDGGPESQEESSRGKNVADRHANNACQSDDINHFKSDNSANDRDVADR